MYACWVCEPGEGGSTLRTWRWMGGREEGRGGGRRDVACGSARPSTSCARRADEADPCSVVRRRPATCERVAGWLAGRPQRPAEDDEASRRCSSLSSWTAVCASQSKRRVSSPTRPDPTRRQRRKQAERTARASGSTPPSTSAMQWASAWRSRPVLSSCEMANRAVPGGRVVGGRGGSSGTAKAARAAPGEQTAREDGPSRASELGVGLGWAGMVLGMGRGRARGRVVVVQVERLSSGRVDFSRPDAPSTCPDRRPDPDTQPAALPTPRNGRPQRHRLPGSTPIVLPGPAALVPVRPVLLLLVSARTPLAG